MAPMGRGKILGASLGNCVHVAGILGFLKLAEQAGYESRFLGPAVSIEKLKEGIREENPDLIAISFRLTPEVLGNLLTSLVKVVEEEGWKEKSFVFGGTPPAAEVAKASGLFDAVFSGLEPLEEISSFLEGKVKEKRARTVPPQSLLERIAYKDPYPLLRHHFGQPTVEATVQGAEEIALSETIDIISLGPDQNSQECFFRPAEMKEGQDGAGGVPLRKPEDAAAIYKASRCGNHPLLRCYAGTRDLLQWAEMCLKTINIAWGAVPLFWYNQLDGRSDRLVVDSIRENQETMAWYGAHDLPLEVNESHHWSLRDAPDSVAVAAAFLAAYNAKAMGVKHYVAQYMFNTPPRTSPPMDLAKMLAKISLIESLHDDDFTSIRQVRAGLASLSPDFDIAKGQMAASCFYQLALKPGILHVVGFCEGDHAATAPDIIESARIVEGVMQRFFSGPLDMAVDSRIQKRKEGLVSEAKLILEAINTISASGVDSPWTDPGTLARAVKTGLLDAPHLCGNPYAAGHVYTEVRAGACVAVDLQSGKSLSEKERITRLLKEAG